MNWLQESHPQYQAVIDRAEQAVFASAVLWFLSVFTIVGMDIVGDISFWTAIPIVTSPITAYLLWSRQMSKIDLYVMAASAVAIVAAVWMLFVNLRESGEFADQIRIIGIGIIVPTIGFLNVYVATNSLRKLKILIGVTAISGITSAAVGILQFVGGEFWIELFLKTGGLSSVSGQLGTGSRTAGLAPAPWVFTSQLIATIGTVSIAIILFTGQRLRIILTLGLLILGLALITSGSRSGIPALGVGLPVALILIYAPTKYRKQLLGIFLASSLLILATGLYLGSLHANDLSLAGRWPRITTAIHVGNTNLMGVGIHRYKDIALPVFTDKASALVVDQHRDSISAHNQFLNAYGIYGLPALILLIGLISIVAKASLNRTGSPRTVLTAMTIVLFATFVSHLVNGLLHNAGLLNGEPYVWITLALLFATTATHSTEDSGT